MALDTNSNKYTFLFSIVLVVVVATLLAVAAESLKPLQKRNQSREKMQNILASVGIEVSADDAEVAFNKYISEELILDGEGKIKESSLSPFDIDVLKDYKSGLAKIYTAHKDDMDAMRKALHEFNNGAGANFPMYVCMQESGEKNYIIPLVGKGLWGPIWGYVALKEDMNTVAGVTFDHKTETPGLGAEINEGWFEINFNDKTIFEGQEFVSIKVMKGGAGKDNPHGVDAISGGTITSNGVGEMLERTLRIYQPYFRNNGNI
jgi:Na+-transporting NADH:ubiquinone oxidoreductase subunit C